MRMYDLILKKKEGGTLTGDEIRTMIELYTKGDIPDYQMSAMLMAICFQGMNDEETLELTLAMRDSGDVLDLSDIQGIKVDKHSTGGVGDKTSLILTPIIASLGVPVAKMSGRGLGHTGGTIDKLESFEGFSTSISKEQFIDNVNRIKVAIAGQTANLAPADKKLYALRDVTATVAQPSLIASSIMSKKLASGSDAIVLDVKTGNGAFMKEYKQAEELAELMVRIGNGAGRKTYAVITDMSQPLGNTVGNAIEAEEAIASLNGDGPCDLMEVVYALGYFMLKAAGVVSTKEEAEAKMKRVIDNKEALKRFAEFVEAQGGDAEMVYHPDRLPKAAFSREVLAEEDGYVASVDALAVGTVCMSLGGGRATKDSKIDLSVGIRLNKKTGDKVTRGECLAWVYGNDENSLIQAEESIKRAYGICKEEVKAPKTVYTYITE